MKPPTRAKPAMAPVSSPSVMHIAKRASKSPSTVPEQIKEPSRPPASKESQTVTESPHDQADSASQQKKKPALSASAEGFVPLGKSYFKPRQVRVMSHGNVKK